MAMGCTGSTHGVGVTVGVVVGGRAVNVGVSVIIGTVEGTAISVGTVALQAAAIVRKIMLNNGVNSIFCALFFGMIFLMDILSLSTKSLVQPNKQHTICNIINGKG